MSAREEKGSAEDENDAHLYYLYYINAAVRNHPKVDREMIARSPGRAGPKPPCVRRGGRALIRAGIFFHIPHVFLIFDALIDCAGAILGTK